MSEQSSMGWPLFIRRVVGHSMEPTLPEGKILIATSLRRPQVGRIAIVAVEGQECVKRIRKLDDSRLWVEGDNLADSYDSRRFGWINRRNVKGYVLINI